MTTPTSAQQAAINAAQHRQYAAAKPRNAAPSITYGNASQTALHVPTPWISARGAEADAFLAVPSLGHFSTAESKAPA